jgi:urocanate hydratase
MLHNNLDPEVAENPDELIVYGGTGRAARDWPSSTPSCARWNRSPTMRRCWCSRAGRWASSARIPNRRACCSPIPTWWALVELGRVQPPGKMGLTMYGQMTAGSWIYIGSQGIVQGTYETFAALARKHFGGSLAGKLVVSGGMGGMGGAQPLAATMNGARFLASRWTRAHPAPPRNRLLRPHGPHAGRSPANCSPGRRRSPSGLVGNCADVLPEMARRGIVPDVLTDQTSAHDPLNGYVPNGMPLEEARLLRARHPEEYVARSMAAMGAHVEAMLELRKAGA